MFGLIQIRVSVDSAANSFRNCCSCGLQLKNAFPFDSAPTYLIFDRDSIFSVRVKQFIKNMDIKPKVISYKSPWQNGVAERFVLSVQNDMLNQMIIFDEEQLSDLMKQYFEYYKFVYLRPVFKIISYFQGVVKSCY